MSADNNNPRLAVLIDADNIDASYCDQLFAEVKKLGEPTIKRVYGDWSKHKDWKQKVQLLGLQPVQQFAHTKTKNAVDIALVIDAMDILSTAKIDGFCIVASDSDYTRLVIRIHENSKSVYGFGQAKAIDTLKNVYTKFVELGSPQNSNALKSNAPISPEDFKNNKDVIKTIKMAIDECQRDDNGWVFLSGLIAKLKQDQDKPINQKYGYKHLSKFLKFFEIFELNETNQKVRIK